MSKAKDKPVKFEEAVAQLEELIERIESGQVGLEESLEAYERGMKLIAHCRGILGAAEKRIVELSVGEGGGEAQGGNEDPESGRQNSEEQET